MLKLIKNEFIKIFKRKNIYILLTIGILIITCYNLFQKITNSNVDISKQYQRAYTNDKMLLENYNQLNHKEDYQDIIERIKLEEYANSNGICYNILLNSENSNAPLSKDARILLMKTFNNFDIIIIFIVVYLSSTIISEESNTGTIKYLLTKPHKRIKILMSKILTIILVTALIVSFIVLFQYLLGGMLFGFDSYSLEAIRYNQYTQLIETMNLANYILLITSSKMIMYILLSLISLLFGIITNNIALNILVSLVIYIISTIGSLINDISKYLFIFNWDISKYFFTTDILVKQSIFISFVTFLLIFLPLIIIFKNKDIKNI